MKEFVKMYMVVWLFVLLIVISLLLCIPVLEIIMGEKADLSIQNIIQFFSLLGFVFIIVFPICFIITYEEDD